MKLSHLFFYTTTIVTIFSCSKADVEEQAEKKPFNHAPSIPVLVIPPANMECAYTSLTFEWNVSTDPEDHEVRYKLQVAENSDFTNLFQDLEIRDNYRSLELDKGKIYYWRVMAIDENQAESQYSDTRSLYTEPKLTYNSIPQNPGSEIPANNSEVQQESLTLQWECLDGDGDQLTYDLFFGLENPPSLFQQNLENTFLEVNLESDKVYYWKVVAKDPHGAKSIGEIWKFKTN